MLGGGLNLLNVLYLQLEGSKFFVSVETYSKLRRAFSTEECNISSVRAIVMEDFIYSQINHFKTICREIQFFYRYAFVIVEDSRTQRAILTLSVHGNRCLEWAIIQDIFLVFCVIDL